MQTAASMEEMAASTKNNADNTRLASEQANIATLQARKGGELMGQVANNMQSITDCAQQMTEIIWRLMLPLKRQERATMVKDFQ